MSDAAAPPRRSARAARWQQPHHGHRLAFVLTLVLIVVVVVSLPFALGSIRTQLFGQQTSDLYDLVSGQVLTPADAANALSQSFFTISIVHIDVGSQVVSLNVAANRTCPSACLTLDVTLFAVANNAAVRRGLPPFGDGDAAPDRPVVHANRPIADPWSTQPLSV